jgi:hypothetical protein
MLNFICINPQAQTLNQSRFGTFQVSESLTPPRLFAGVGQ